MIRCASQPTQARNAMQDLFTAVGYAAMTHGVGKRGKSRIRAMTNHEWHGHFDKMMTQLTDAQERLKVAMPHTNEFEMAHSELRAVAHELDCLTNPAMTTIEAAEKRSLI